MSATIDRLDIAIAAQAKDAIQQVDAMYGSLERVSNALNGINTSKLNLAGKGISGLGNAAKSTVSPVVKATLSLKNLLKVALGFAGIRSVINFGKQAIDLASSLTEVQNVVENSFGTKGTENIEKFVEGSIEKFGMSELMAKQVASRYQAMGNAMGITAGQIADATGKVADRMNKDLYDTSGKAMGAMAMNLTSLAADMASFYNVEQETAATALNSIYTGNTRPLRQFGLDLTQATLQEWAMKQGMDADIQSMSQAQKTLLRYQYVMANTSTIQRDFARTSMTWANQVRQLRENFKVLAATVGETLVNAFRPLIIWLNKAMSHVIAFAETIGNALGKIFGWKILHTPASTAADSLGELAESLDDAGAGGSDAADGINDTTDAVKKLERTILGFDEINKLNEISAPSTNKSGSGSGGSGDTGTGTVDASGADFMVQQSRSWLEEYKSNIQSLYGLGKEISGKLADALESIEWDTVFRKARNFGTDLASFLNGLISPRLFYDLGMTVANSINTALVAALSFGSHFNWTNLGLSVASLINGFFDNFNFSLLAESINAWALGILNAIVAAVENVKWRNIGWKVRQMLLKIKWKEILEAVGKAIGAAFNAAIEFAKGLFSDEGLEDNPFTKALDQIKTSAENFMDEVDWDGITKAITRIVTALKPVFEGIGQGLADFFSALAKIGAITLNLIGAALKTIASALESMDPTSLSRLGTALGIIAGALLTINTVKGAVDTVGTLIGKVKGLGTVAGEAAGGAAAGGAAGGSAGGLAALGAAAKSAFGSFMLNGGFVPAITFATAGVASFVDGLRGGNGALSGWSKVLGDLNFELAGTKVVAVDDANAIDQMVEAAEDGKIPTEQLAISAAKVYHNAGLTADEVERLYVNLNDGVGPIGEQAEAMNMLTGHMNLLALASEHTNAKASPLENLFNIISGAVSNTDSKVGLFKGGLFGMAGSMAGKMLLMAIMGTTFKTAGTKVDNATTSVDNFDTAVSGMSETVGTEIVKLGESFDDAPGLFADGMTSEMNMAKMNSAGKGLVDEASNGVETGLAGLSTIVTGIGTSLSKDIKDDGKEISGGLADGMTDTESLDRVDRAIEIVCGRVTGGGRALMKIASPSKVMEEMGKYVVLGFANGISNNLINITTQVNNMMLKITAPIQTMINGMQAKGADAVNKFKTGMASVSFSDALTKMFSSMNFKSLNTSLNNAGKTAGGYLASGLKSVSMPRLSYYISSWDAHSLTNGGTSYTPTYSPSWYALGGFPNMGELFIAGERGPEMLGKMGHRNVVANNQQITAGIKAAVVDGMMEVAMSGVLGGANDSTPYVMNVTVKTENDETLARAVQRGQMRRGSRFNPTAASMI